MTDPKFKEILSDLGKKPDNLVKYMQDHRVMEALAVLLNVDMSAAAGKVIWHRTPTCNLCMVNPWCCGAVRH